MSAWHGPMTCALQARFDTYRLCMSMAKQGAGMTPMAGFGASMREGAGARDCRQAFEGQHAQCAPVPVAPRVEPPPAEPACAALKTAAPSFVSRTSPWPLLKTPRVAARSEPVR